MSCSVSRFRSFYKLLHLSTQKRSQCVQKKFLFHFYNLTSKITEQSKDISIAHSHKISILYIIIRLLDSILAIRNNSRWFLQSKHTKHLFNITLRFCKDRLDIKFLPISYRLRIIFNTNSFLVLYNYAYNKLLIVTMKVKFQDCML